MSILEFQHVSKVYHNTTRALDDLSFSVNEGEFVSIIGPSGAGKSTILRCINRLIDATEGKIIYDVEDIMSLRKGQLRNVRTKTGMIFQHYNLVERLSVMENVLHGRLGQKSTFSGMIGHYTESEKERRSPFSLNWDWRIRRINAAMRFPAVRNSVWELPVPSCRSRN